MPEPRGASTNGQAPLGEAGVHAPSEFEQLQFTCRRQAGVIDALGETIAVLRAAAAEGTDRTEVRLRLDTQAPAAARAIVASRLRDRLPAPVFDSALLLTSELVSNSVLHSAAAADAVLVFRLELSRRSVRLEVEDPGHHGAVAPRPPDLHGGGGFGLNLVQQLSERWGLERVATGGTRVWSYVALDPPVRKAVPRSMTPGGSW